MNDYTPPCQVCGQWQEHTAGLWVLWPLPDGWHWVRLCGKSCLGTYATNCLISSRRGWRDKANKGNGDPPPEPETMK
jgi:hypothetical protein